jgi:hypothetical protein
MKRRTVIIVMLLLLGGAIVNVAVAWGGAFRLREVGDAKTFRSHAQDPCWFLLIGRGPNCHWIIAQKTPFGYGDEEHPPIDVPHWSKLRSRPDTIDFQAVSDTQSVFEGARGWPCLGLVSRARYETFGNTVIESSGGFVLKSEHWWFIFGRMLPYQPVWPGFAINTIFYAAILCGLFFAPGMVKRGLRRRRGLCPACAYPIGSSPVCTECGSPLKIRTGMGLPLAPQATPATDRERTT